MSRIDAMFEGLLRGVRMRERTRMVPGNLDKHRSGSPELLDRVSLK